MIFYKTSWNYKIIEHYYKVLRIKDSGFKNQKMSEGMANVSMELDGATITIFFVYLNELYFLNFLCNFALFSGIKIQKLICNIYMHV